MRTLILATAVALAACSSTPKPPQEVRLKFDPNSHRSYFPAGTGEIRGQAFLRQRDVSGVPCDGSAVIATPATAFFRQMLDLAARGQMPLIGEAVGPEYISIVRLSVCDKDGGFSIAGLPAGDWLVAATVKWVVRGDIQGGLLVYKVRLHPKETVQVVMTDRDLEVPR